MRSLALLIPLCVLAAVLASHGRIPAPTALREEPSIQLMSEHAEMLRLEEVDGRLSAAKEIEDEGVLPEPVQWSREDKQLRRYSFETPEVHESLLARLEELSPAQRRTRDWLLRSRSTSLGGAGIGLGAADPPEPIRPAPAAEAHDSPPSADEGPGLYSSGSYDKYKDLVQEWKTGRPVEACEKGSWEEEYAKLHREMLSGKREARLLEFVCRKGEYCGGVADRLLGMVTTFLYSLLTNRAFSMVWEQPAPLDLLFDSPHIDWSRPFDNLSTTPVRLPYSNETLLAERREVNAHNWEEKKIDEWMPRFVDEYGEGKGTPWLQLDFNRGVVIRSFTYPSIRPSLDRLGLKLETAYSCLLNYLLRPKPAVQAFIAQYTSLFSLPEYFVVGLQVRTGDLAMWAAKKDAVNTVAAHGQYFRCAASVSRLYAQPGQKTLLYLVTDSHALEEDVLALSRTGQLGLPAGTEVVVTGLKQAHMEIKTDKTDGLKAVRRAADGFMRTVAEMWIFASTDFQILTYRSGFGKIPTWLRGRQNTTIQLFNPHTDPEYTRAVRKKNKGKLPREVDCSRPEALKSFEQMALDWSLG